MSFPASEAEGRGAGVVFEGWCGTMDQLDRPLDSLIATAKKEKAKTKGAAKGGRGQGAAKSAKATGAKGGIAKKATGARAQPFSKVRELEAYGAPPEHSPPPDAPPDRGRRA